MSLTKRCLLWIGLALIGACGVENSDPDNDGSRGALAAAEKERSDDKEDDGDNGAAPADDEEGDDGNEDGDGDGGPERPNPECPQGEPTGPVRVTFRCDEITVNTCKDLSNVVLLLEDGSRQRFEGLTGHENTFAATGEHEGDVIVGVWVKAGANHSGDGPGYGERFDAPADHCDGTEPPAPPVDENPPADDPSPVPGPL